MTGMSEDEILDYDAQLAFYRRNGDRRYYKGVEYCNMMEALAQRRGAEVFCPPGMTPEQVFVNVQPLSGAVANTAIYEALVQPGDTVMTLDLLHGGHLSHGSPVNITGHRQRVVHYRVSEETELLDYEEIYELAQREKPKMIIAGYTSYPLAPDFEKFRAIADSVGAYLLADIAHTAGMACSDSRLAREVVRLCGHGRPNGEQALERDHSQQHRQSQLKLRLCPLPRNCRHLYLAAPILLNCEEHLASQMMRNVGTTFTYRACPSSTPASHFLTAARSGMSLSTSAIVCPLMVKQSP